MKKLLKGHLMALVSLLAVLLLVGCGSGNGDKPEPNQVDVIGSNVDPSSYITVLESMSGPDRRSYIEKNKTEFDLVMANATPEEKERLDAVMKLP